MSRKKSVMQSVAPELERWLRTVILKGHVREVALVHLSADGKVSGRIQTLTGIPAETDDGWIKQTAEDMQRDIQFEADSLAAGRAQTYAVLAYYGEEEKYGSRKAFVVTGKEADEEGSEVLTEPASQEGIIRQLMRHQEGTQRTLLEAVRSQANFSQGMLQMMAAQNDKLSELVDKGYEARTRMMIATEEFIDNSSQRKLQAEKEMAVVRQRDQMLKEVRPLLPVIANKIAGKKLFPEGAVGENIQDKLKRLASGMTAEKLEALEKVLSDEDQMIIGELMAAAMSEAPPADDGEGG